MLTYPLKVRISVFHNQGNSKYTSFFYLGKQLQQTRETFDLGAVLSPFGYSHYSLCLDGEQILV